MKKYFHLRICKSCDEQKMVNNSGHCKECEEPALIINDILEPYHVKTWKETNDGLVAIHKKIKGAWFWLYFRFNGIGYMLTGSTERFEK